MGYPDPPAITVAADNDTTASGSSTGDLPTGPAAPLPQQQQAEGAAARKAAAPAGSSTSTPQGYNVTVPFSGTSLTMGAAAGGPGASLTTLGNVLLDAVGTMGLQAAGDFTAQTTAAMGLLSTGGTDIHSGGGISVYAGGGSAPGPCGSGGPAAPGPCVPPAMTAENVTNLACAATALTKATFNGTQCAGFTKAKALVDGGIALASGGGAVAKMAGDAPTGPTKRPFTDPANLVFKAANAIGLPALAPSALTDIEERASGNIKMVAGFKITGSAPYQIEFKTAVKYSVNAALVTDFITTLFGIFAAAKVEVKTFGSLKTSSSKFELKAKLKSDFSTKKLTIDAKTKTTIIGSTLITLKGPTQITGDTTIKKTLDVSMATTLKDTLTVDGKTVTEKHCQVSKGNTLLEGKLEVVKAVKAKADVTVVKRFKGNKKFDVVGRVTLGG